MYIKNFQQYFEAKNVGILYHFTSLIATYQIIKYDEMQTLRSLEGLPHFAKMHNMEDTYIYKYYFSFTRNKNFHHPQHSNDIDTSLTCRIDIDGTKMSNKYKIYPVSYYSNAGKPISGFGGSDESEEIVISDDNYLKGISKYIVNVNVCNKDMFHNEMLEFINTESEEKIEDIFTWVKEELGIESEEIDNIIESPENVQDIYSETITSQIYDIIYSFIKSKYPNLKEFKSEQMKLNY